MVVFVVAYQFHWHFLKWVAGQNTQTQNTQAQNTKSQNTKTQNTRDQNTQVPKYLSIEVFWVLLTLRHWVKALGILGLCVFWAWVYFRFGYFGVELLR